MRRLGWLLMLVACGCRGEPAAWLEAEWLEPSGASGSPALEEAGEQAGVVSGERGQAWNDGCHAEPVSLDELHSGLVRSGSRLSVPGLVASSRKFLMSQSKAGSCVWGAFAAGEGRTGAGSGLLLISFGAPRADGQPCAPGTDGLPDDLELGDALEAQGWLDDYAPSTCSGVVPARQLRIDRECPLRRSGQGALPEPAPIDAAFATRIAAGDDPRTLGDYGGALVSLAGVSARQDADDGDAVFDFGVIRPAQTELEVSSRLYYYDLREGGPGVKAKAPRFSYPRKFQRIIGLIFLDYCRWVIAPRDRCDDFSPPSEGCASNTRP